MVSTRRVTHVTGHDHTATSHTSDDVTLVRRVWDAVDEAGAHAELQVCLHVGGGGGGCEVCCALGTGYLCQCVFQPHGGGS